MSKKFYFEIVEWPGGYGLCVSSGKDEGGYGFAGASGGGVGRTVRKFTVSGIRLEKLKEILNEE